MVSRRKFMVSLLSVTALTGFGVALPGRAFAGWNRSAFEATELDLTLQTLWGDTPRKQTDQIDIVIEQEVADGDQVPVLVTTKLNADRIQLLVPQNRTPLVADILLPPRAEKRIMTRLRLTETSEIIVIAAVEGELFTASRNVELTAIPCSNGLLGGDNG